MNNRKYHFNRFLQDPKTSDTLLKYLSSENRTAIDKNQIETDQQYIQKTLLNQLPENAEVNFYLLDPDGNTVLSLEQGINKIDFLTQDPR